MLRIINRTEKREQLTKKELAAEIEKENKGGIYLVQKSITIQPIRELQKEIYSRSISRLRKNQEERLINIFIDSGINQGGN